MQVPNNFKPRSYQKEFLDNYKANETSQLITGKDGRTRYIGVDMAKQGADKSVMAVAQTNRRGHTTVVYDEASNFFWPKWYRNPIQWWKFRQMMKKLIKASRSHLK